MKYCAEKWGVENRGFQIGFLNNITLNCWMRRTKCVVKYSHDFESHSPQPAVPI